MEAVFAKLRAERYVCGALVLTAALALGTFAFKKIFFMPAYWCGLILVMLLFMPRMHAPGHLHLRESILGYSFAGAVILIAIRFGAGFLLGAIAATPYDISPQGVFLNLIDLLPAIAAREMIRAYAIGTINQRARAPFVWLVPLSLLFAAFEINFARTIHLNTAESWFIYVAKDVMPLIVESGLLCLLVFYGGASAGVIYKGGMSAFLRVFPFLPSLPWIAESALGIAVPTVMAIFVRDQYRRLSRVRQVRQEPGQIVWFTALLGIGVAFLWFVVGVFPVYPSVVLTGSMEPLILPGDVVLVQKLAQESELYELIAGDIINFNFENITVTHRIQEVLYDQSGNVSFLTKGDNNQSEDDNPVLPNDINGRIVNVIPKAGLPVLFMHSNQPIPQEVLDE